MCGWPLHAEAIGYGHRYVCAVEVEWTKPELTKGAGDSPAEIPFPDADGQCLGSSFSSCSELNTDLMGLGEWKPFVNPMSCCGAVFAVVWCPLSSVSPLWLTGNVFKGVPEGLPASESFSRGSSSPGELSWLRGEYTSSDNEGPLVVLDSPSPPSSSFSLSGSDSSEWTMTSASTRLLHRDVHRWSSNSCNKTMSLLHEGFKSLV